MAGPDHKASLEPAAFAEFVRAVRDAEAALGDGIKRRQPSEEDTATVARKSLVAAVDIDRGALITAEMLARKRPGTGLHPGLEAAFIGRRAGRDIGADTLLSWDDLA
jgi:N-acetylneuraminate synthase/N,N'-diacetyllegionaminate synthase